ncbi:MAG: phage major capsid protein [Terriglobales bacterium]
MDTLSLRQDRFAIVQEMRTLANSTKPADAARWKQLDAQQEQLRVQIENDERTSSLEKELAQVRNAERPNIHVPGERAATAPERIFAIRSQDSYKKDFETYIRTGRMSEDMEECRALGAASGADGATLVPQGFEAELEIKMKAYGGITRLCRTITTSTGNPLPWPNLDDTTNTGEWLTEGSGVGSADPTFSNVTLGANLLSSKQVKVSVQLEQDSAFDIVGLMSDIFAVRLGRTSNAAYTIGDGSGTYGTITGLINALVAAGGRSVLAIGGNNNSGDAGNTDLNSIGTDDLDNLIAQTDPAYRIPGRAKFAANQATWDTFRKLKDKYGRPVWAVSLTGNQPDTIRGYGIDWNQDMAKIGAGNISVVFGDWDKFVVRQALGFTFVRFNELYMTNYQRAYQAFCRVDAKLLQAAAFSYLIHPLS